MSPEHLMYGHAGSAERAKRLGRLSGVYHLPLIKVGEAEVRDIILVEPVGLLRLMRGGGGARETSEGIEVYAPDGQILLYPLAAWPEEQTGADLHALLWSAE